MKKISGYIAQRMWGNADRRGIPDNRRCENCDGDGCVTIPHYRSSDGYGETYAECPDCDGSGEVEPEETEEESEEK